MMAASVTAGDHRRDRNDRADRKEEITDNRSADSNERPAPKPRHERADNQCAMKNRSQ